MALDLEEGSIFKNQNLDDDFQIKIKSHDDIAYEPTVAQSSLQIRLGFIRKVYGILSAQLGFITLISAFFMYNENVKNFFQQSPNFLIFGIFGLITLIGLGIAMMVKRKESPINMYLLAAFTFAGAHTIGTIVTVYDEVILLQGIGLTIATLIPLTVYTFQSNIDYNAWVASLFSMLWILILGGLMQMFLQSDVTKFALAVAVAILFTGFIILDMRMMLHKLSPEEYILAVINCNLQSNQC